MILQTLLPLAYDKLLKRSNQDPRGIEAQIEFVENWDLIPMGLVEDRIVGFLTHMFLHGSVMYWVGNMLELWSFAGSSIRDLGADFSIRFIWFGGYSQTRAYFKTCFC